MASPKTHQVAPSPLGTLGNLPKEIRETIYQYLVCGAYFFPDVFVQVDNTFYKVEGQHLLATSRALSSEALELMYRKSTFTIDIMKLYASRGFDLTHQVNTQRISNLRVIIDLRTQADVWFIPLDKLSVYFHAEFEGSPFNFRASSTRRLNFTLETVGRKWEYETLGGPRLMDSFFGRVCKGLVTFEHVSVRVVCMPLQNPLQGDGHHSQSFSEQLRAGVKTLLGPSESKAYIGNGMPGSFEILLDFYPQKFHAQRQDVEIQERKGSGDCLDQS